MRKNERSDTAFPTSLSDPTSKMSYILRLGIFGGTFDPIHFGHLIVAEEVKEKLKLSKLFLVPAASSPHKLGHQILRGSHRAAMIRLAIKGNPYFAFSDLEIKRPGLSYTIDTLREFRRQNLSAKLFFVMGADQFVEIETWKEPEEIFRLSKVVVMTRPGFDLNQVKAKWRKKVVVVKVSQIGVSATEIRHRIKMGHSIRYLVPASVESYIRQNKLYL
ncbi:MAG: nicotinate-nucleotide adenylyltransferase [Candidatus Edwardsbacteria bacterium]